MKKAGLFAILLGLLILTTILIFRPPAIPHSLDGMKDCLTCHGSNGAAPYPAWHATRAYGKDDCSDCHHVKSGIRSSAGAIAK